MALPNYSRGWYTTLVLRLELPGSTVRLTPFRGLSALPRGLSSERAEPRRLHPASLPHHHAPETPVLEVPILRAVLNRVLAEAALAWLGMSSFDRTGDAGVSHPILSDSLGVVHIGTSGSMIRPRTPRLSRIASGCKHFSSIDRSH